MPDLRAFFRSAPVSEFSGTVYRICPARYSGNVVSMRGSILYGARYNIRGYFGTLYTSLSKDTARREIARYFTVPPIDGFVEASIGLQLHRVVDLTNRGVLRRATVLWQELNRNYISPSLRKSGCGHGNTEWKRCSLHQPRIPPNATWQCFWTTSILCGAWNSQASPQRNNRGSCKSRAKWNPLRAKARTRF